jgi:hypothetical protein
LTRIGAPGLGAVQGPYLKKGEFQFASQISRFSTNDQFGGGAFEGNQQRSDLYATDSQVNEGGAAMDMNLGYGLSRQFSLDVSVPLILYSNWSTRLAGTRYNQKVQGIGDTSVGVTWAMMNCNRYPDMNISFGLNVRVPTGDSNYQVLYPNSLGQDFKMRPVHPGVQPGSGAWAIRPSVSAFKQFRRFTLFGTATYQFSLRDHNDTFALGAALNPAGPSAVREELRYLSTPDSYLVNLGAGVPLRKLGVTAFMNWRAVGVPVHNVFGNTFGYRQPGYYVTAEPGVSWVMGRAAYSVSVPLRMWAGTKNNFLDLRASSDFARYALVGSVSFRFGGKAPEPKPAGHK